MTRDLVRLTGRYDVLIVGGGIHGLFAAYDAAGRGLRVALVERDDFGAGLSFNHQRTVHGGLRAMQGLRVRKVREQLAERRIWTILAPHLIRPLPFAVGTYGFGVRGRLGLGVGLTAYDLLGRDRNAGVPHSLHIPPARLISRQEMRSLFPSIDPVGLTGGAQWYDYQTRHPDRINWLVARAAMRAGAHLINYTECLGPLRDRGLVVGARVRRWPSGQEEDIEARTLLFCAGSGLAELHDRFGLTGAPPLLRAMNLLLDRPGPDMALAARGRSGRMLTCIPWNGLALVGTFQSDTIVDPRDQHPAPSLLDAMIEDTRSAFAHLAVDRAAIRLVHHGLTPASVAHGHADLLPDSQLLRHDAGNLYSLVGVKFTTARLTASRAVDEIARQLGVLSLSSTAKAELHGGGAPDVQRAGADAWPSEDAGSLADWYGDETAQVMAHASRTGLTTRLVPESPVLRGEIDYACEDSAVLRLGDVVLRRTRLGEMGHPGAEALRAAAAIMAPRFGWSPAEHAAEIAHVEARFSC